MKNLKKILKAGTILLLVGVLVIGCTTLGFKKKAVENSLRPIEEIKLDNGLVILFIPEPSLPRVSFHLSVGMGSQSDPIGAEGIANLTVDALESGTSHRSASKLAEDLEYLGSELSLHTGLDQSSIAVHGMSMYQEDLLGIFSDVILNPAFQEPEILKKKKEIIAQIEKQKDNPDIVIDQLFRHELFQGTRWSSPVLGYKSTLDKIARTEVIKTYFQFFRPNNSVLVVGGKFDESFKEKVKTQFGAWQPKEVKYDVGPVLVTPPSTRVIFYHREGLEQAQVQMGHRSIPRAHADYLKYRLSNFILGGAFASRLNQKVRDDLGLTYSISSVIEGFRDVGIFKIETFCAHEKLVQTLQESFQVFNLFKNSGVKNSELDSAKNMMIGQFPSVVETVDSQGALMAMLRMYRVSDDYVKYYNYNLEQSKLSDVNDVILKGYYPNELLMVIYGDKNKVKGLEQLPWPVEYKDYLSKK